MSTLEELKTKWSAAKTHREKAAIENEIVVVIGPRETKPGQYSGFRSVLRDLLGEAANHFESRRTMYLAGPAAEPLWRLVDGPERTPVARAHKLLADARKRSKKNHAPLASTVGDVVAEYLKLPKFSGKRHGYHDFRRDMGRSKRRSKDAWSELRSTIDALVRSELRRVVDARERSDLSGQIQAEIGIMFDLLRGRIRNVREGASLGAAPIASARVQRTRLREACLLLGVDPPTPGKSADGTKARRMMRKLAARYHPDTVGDDSMRPQYEAVLAAYQTIETYNQSV